MATFDLTFTDWDSYTDGMGNSRTLDWTAANMQGVFCYPFLDALRQSLNERMVISHRGLTRDPYELPPVSSVQNNTAWEQYVLKSCIYYLRTELAPWNRSDSRAFLTWVAPGTLPTLVDQTYYTYPTALRAGAYCGLYGSITNWAEAQTRLLDAAGVLDTTFRTWWLQMQEGGLYGWPIEVNLLYPNAYLVWALKSMFSQLVRSVSDYRQSSSAWERMQVVDWQYREVIQDWTDLATLNAAFNATSWTTGTPLVRDYSYGGGVHCTCCHGGQIGYGLPWPFVWNNPTGVLQGVIVRRRYTYQFPTHDQPISSGEYGFMLSWGTAGSVARPILNTDDFPEITVGYSGPWKNYIVCHSSRTFSEEDMSGETHVVGDYGDSQIKLLKYKNPNLVWNEGWHGGDWALIVQNFDVPGGFVFQ